MIGPTTHNRHLADPIHSFWLPCCAVLLAAVALCAIITGAAFTANEERPFYSFGQSHLMVAALVGVLTIGLVIWLLLTEKRVWMRRLAWIVLATVIVEGLLGLVTVPQPPAVRLVHAFLAQLFFTTTVAIAIFTSRGWARVPEFVRCRPSLRVLALITAFLVLVQATLGVAFRHGVITVTLHLLGAFVAAIFVAVLAMWVLYRPGHEPLRPAGVTLLIVTAVQVFLGLALFSISFTDIDPGIVIIVTMVHTAMAALTLTAAVVTAVLILCSISASVNR